MALNYSHRPVFPAHLAEDNLVSPMRIVNGYLVEGVPERNGEAFTRLRNNSQEIDECFNFAPDRARVDRCGSQETVSKDIIDLLPSDPFGMDLSSTVTAITGWLEDLEVDYGIFGRSYVGGACNEEYDLFADLNMIWNNAVMLQSFSSYIQFDEKLKIDIEGDGPDEKGDFGDALYRYSSISACNEGDIAGLDNGSPSEGFNDESPSEGFHDKSPNEGFNKRSLIEGFNNESPSEGFSNGSNALQSEEKAEGLTCCDGSEGEPNRALEYVLCFLGVKDLLSVGMVCRYLYNKVCGDNLLWRSIHIDQPLNEKITDDILLQLAGKAKGNLECLSLVECPRITDDSLRRVVETNRQLTKLCVPGCTRLSIAGIVNIVKAFNSDKGFTGIKHLRIGGLYGITNEHFDELVSLLGGDSSTRHSGDKPCFYHRGNLYILCDDDRAIDVETCPRCNKLRLLYDCPDEGCQVKGHTAQVCRACTLCIPRCVECGRCINDNEYEETFCLELLCSDCFKQLPKFQDRIKASV